MAVQPVPSPTTLSPQLAQRPEERRRRKTGGCRKNDISGQVTFIRELTVTFPYLKIDEKKWPLIKDTNFLKNNS